MKLRMFALAGVALAALSTSASAAEGWYLGLGAGISHLDPVRYSHASPTLSVAAKHDSNGAFLGAFGYQFAGFVRLESEIAYSSHDVSASTGGTGSTQITTDMFNIIADVPVYNDWKLSVGAGLGAGSVRESISTGGFVFASGQKTGLAWQGIAGVSVPVSPEVDLYADFRYRNVELNQGYTSGFTTYNPIIVKGTHESNIMFGLRWHLG